MAPLACSTAHPRASTPAPQPAAGLQAGSPQSTAEPRHFAFNPVPCPQLPPAVDTMADTVYLTLEAPGRRDPLPAGYPDRMLAVLRDAFVLPHPLELPVFGEAANAAGAPAGAGGVDRVRLAPAISGEVQFTVGADGRLSTAAITASSLSPTLDASLVRMPRRADSSGLLPWNPSFGRAVRTTFFAAVTTTRPPAGWWVALFPLHVPRWRDGELARIRTAPPAPSPPPDNGTPHREDTAVVQFVIDEQGRPVPSTMRVVEAHYLEFARAAIARIEQTSYRPAAIAGCAVKELWRERYTFPVAH